MTHPGDLTEAERQLLCVLWKADLKGSSTDRWTLKELGRRDIGRRVVDWTDAYPRLEEKGLLSRKGEDYSLTESGAACRRELHRDHPYWLFLYDEFYARAEESDAHSILCERVYGRDLCQQGMMNMAQLHELIQVLGLDKGNRVIELGCGSGGVAEYISDKTGAHVTGVDLSEEGIRRARGRTDRKSERLRFLRANLNDFEFPEGPFDTLISIDTLYFVDMDPLIGRAKEALGPGGRMAILQSHWLRPYVPQETLQPEKTPLAEVLKSQGLRFTTRDFSEEEDAHWQRLLDVLGELRPRFEAEGHLPLHEFRLEEAQANAQWNGTGKRVRHLYHVGI